MASYAELFDIGEDFAAFVGHGLATEQGAVARGSGRAGKATGCRAR